MRNDVEGFINQLSSDVIQSILAEVSPYVQAEKEEDVRCQLVSMLTNEDTLTKIWTHLSQYEKQVLKYFIYQVNDDFLTYRQIGQGLQGIKPNSFRLGLTGLRRKGFIYTVRRQWGEVAYILPNDVGNLLYRLQLSSKNDERIESCIEFVYKDKETYPPLYIDLFLLLVQLRAEKDNAISLTKKGSIHKRHVRTWQETWPNREGALTAFSFTYEHRDTYSQHIALVLDFLTKSQIIIWYEAKLVLNSAKAEQWMQLSRVEMREQLLNYWLSMYRPSFPWLRRYQLDMLDNKHADWMYLLSFVEQWEDEYLLPNVQELQQLIRKEILDPLLGFGFIEIGKTDAGEEVWRWKVEREEQGTIWVQPTLEIYCPSTLSFSILWELTKLLALEKWETMLVMGLSKSKVLRSIEQGEKWTAWLNTLENRLSCSFPAAFVDQLEMWAKSKSQVRLSQKTVLEIEDDALATAWLKWPELAEFEVKEIGLGIFLVDLEKRDEMAGLFAKKGVPVQQVSVEAEHAQEIETRNFLITSPYEQERELRVESVFPDLTEAIPAWQTLPELWKKQLSPYHEQTKRFIVKQAIEHELTLKIETDAGDLMEILPTYVQVEDGRWVCYDVQDKRYDLDHLHRLQLLFPVSTDSC